MVLWDNHIMDHNESFMFPSGAVGDGLVDECKFISS